MEGPKEHEASKEYRDLDLLDTPLRLRDLNPKRFFLDTFRALDTSAAQERLAAGQTSRPDHDGTQPDGVDLEPTYVYVFAILLLILMEYVGMPRGLRTAVRIIDSWLGDSLHWQSLSWHLGYSNTLPGRGPYAELLLHSWWVFWRIVGFACLPAIFLRVRGKSIGSCYLSLKGTWNHFWIYGLFFSVVAIFVFIASDTPSFQAYYPFYRLAYRSWFDLLCWELLYALQFFSLEFFFRGFLLSSSQKSLGSHAIIVMTIPYVMIHFGKPWIETVGAIAAGITLGTLAMRTRSIWGGVFIHVSIALCMDLASLLQQQGLPQSLWPTAPPDYGWLMP